ncbi:hypothetical protein [Streptomyces sp. NPDC002580]
MLQFLSVDFKYALAMGLDDPGFHHGVSAWWGSLKMALSAVP